MESSGHPEPAASSTPCLCRLRVRLLACARCVFWIWIVSEPSGFFLRASSRRSRQRIKTLEGLGQKHRRS
jgi:hypothetical protein